MRTTTTIPLCALVLAACATTLDAEGCRGADWKKMGRLDGGAGRESQLQAHAAACAPYGIKPDAATYSKGLEEGRASRATSTTTRNVSLF